jgi:hypothetical protein
MRPSSHTDVVGARTSVTSLAASPFQFGPTIMCVARPLVFRRWLTTRKLSVNRSMKA